MKMIIKLFNALWNLILWDLYIIVIRGKITKIVFSCSTLQIFVVSKGAHTRSKLESNF